MAGYMPRADALFNTWITAFMTYATANLAALGINPLSAEWTNLVAAYADWQTAYPDHITAQNAAQAAA